MILLSTTIEVPESFSLKATALSHGWHECSPISWSEGGSCLQIIERAGSRARRVSVTEQSGRKNGATLRVAVEGDRDL